MFNNLLDGKCGIDRITRFDEALSPIKIASEVKDFDVTKFWEPKDAKRYDRYAHFAMAAAKTAMVDGKLNKDDVNSKRFGVIIGSGVGGLESVEESCRILFNKGPKRITPFLLPSIIGNTAGGLVAIELGAKGPNFGVVSACATGTHAIGEALRFLQMGDCDVMLAGGTEAAITPLGFAGFASMRAMCSDGNENPKTCSRPFDAERSGFVMGEGAGVLLLETEEHALKRGAKIYCELAGYAANCDAFHITAPHPEGEGMSDCLQMAVDSAGIKLTDVQYVNAHGTSTPLNDKFETMAYKRVFGDHAHKLKISSTKGALGHLLGAAGSVEAAICCKVIETGSMPPTLNYKTPDPECDLDYIPNVKFVSDKPVEVAISDNLGFGGHNAALVFKRYQKA
ncbi:3-oxoacyl-(acyl-carrier-protein) synthase 2 [Chrysochromulina tobinii]|uniref:Nodulation protein E n=1 Tax=Chrysochromulina tobinii TaxID=1460289 RepID=A0A0M0JSN4_9EUKA|nr:3-oxoacyl-(acyl-carrier-protein) synthase 2 [Chrysochromulina tobinii]|eukprot:KOO29495.1 3-oxoacyl-(acyl-carrier-protein) synthase 2 [Chrysochromulina sp. CCMP291]